MNQILAIMTNSFLFSCSLFFAAYGMQQAAAQTEIPVDEAYRMVANYAPRAGFVARDDQQLPNTRTVWFSLQQLKAFIDQIENDGGDGVRFYFAAYDDVYPDSAEGPHVPPREYWGYNTLLMVPTRDSVAHGITYHEDYLTRAKLAESLSGSGGSKDESTIENRGNLCPPLCGDNPKLLK